MEIHGESSQVMIFVMSEQLASWVPSLYREARLEDVQQGLEAPDTPEDHNDAPPRDYPWLSVWNEVFKKNDVLCVCVCVLPSYQDHLCINMYYYVLYVHLLLTFTLRTIFTYPNVM